MCVHMSAQNFCNTHVSAHRLRRKLQAENMHESIDLYAHVVHHMCMSRLQQ